MFRLYLSCMRRVASKLVNPYKSETGFHITFYEKMQQGPNSQDSEDRQGWKVGFLYEKPNSSGAEKHAFRQSAFTVSTLSPCKRSK